MTQFSVGEFRTVADGVLVAVAEPAGVNIGLVVGPSGCLVVDTGSSPAQGALIRERAEQAAGVPVVAVVVTHWHYDHFFGLAGFAGLPAYAHESVAEWLERPECAGDAAELGVDADALVAPNRPFSLARVVDVGGRRVEVVHFGRGHTDGDVVVFVPDAGVIFTGDLLESAGTPHFGPDCHLKEWPSAVDGVLGLVAEETVLVPGHGPVMDRLAAFTQRAEISGLYGQVEYLVARGVKIDDAWEQGEWPFDEQTVRAVLPLAYAQLAGEGKVPRTQLPLV
ncbi:MAG: MBL fold metallo-hydrolase [Propionicimonas sp.]|uniref:MBL fold metallo-hydrolase n=1 Tax=Propionicimonas sp. TaxID=1955623 RepID=UPI003D13257B